MESTRRMTLVRSVLVWLAIISVETIHGIVRALWLVPLVGDLRSRQIGVPVGSILIFLIACLTVAWIGGRTRQELFTTGAIWVILTMVFEVSLGVGLGYSWERIFSDYDPRAGGFMIAGLLFMLFAPFLAARIRQLS